MLHHDSISYFAFNSNPQQVLDPREKLLNISCPCYYIFIAMLLHCTYCYCRNHHRKSFLIAHYTFTCKSVLYSSNFLSVLFRLQYLALSNCSVARNGNWYFHCEAMIHHVPWVVNVAEYLINWTVMALFSSNAFTSNVMKLSLFSEYFLIVLYFTDLKRKNSY